MMATVTARLRVLLARQAPGYRIERELDRIDRFYDRIVAAELERAMPKEETPCAVSRA